MVLKYEENVVLECRGKEYGDGSTHNPHIQEKRVGVKYVYIWLALSRFVCSSINWERRVGESNNSFMQGKKWSFKYNGKYRWWENLLWRGRESLAFINIPGSSSPLLIIFSFFGITTAGRDDRFLNLLIHLCRSVGLLSHLAPPMSWKIICNGNVCQKLGGGGLSDPLEGSNHRLSIWISWWRIYIIQPTYVWKMVQLGFAS